MSDKPTLPPTPPKRPPAKPTIKPVQESFSPNVRIIDPFKGLPKEPVLEKPRRHYTPTELDITTARHDEQIKGLERRVDTLEEVTDSADKKMDEVLDLVRNEKQARELAAAIKEQEKINEDQKTKRLQAILVAIPLILSPIIAGFTSYMGRDTDAAKHIPTTVVVSEYTQEAAKCKETQKSEKAFVECIREAQLKNTPIFGQ